MKELEKLQAQAAEKAFSKAATAKVIAKAAVGDLGWLSIKLQIIGSQELYNSTVTFHACLKND
jgi:hypothetical protein